MLHKGMAVIVRNKEEASVFEAAVHKKGYEYVTGQAFKCEKYYPVRYSINMKETHHCMSKCDTINFPLNDGITKVIEASDLFRNQLISMRKRCREASK